MDLASKQPETKLSESTADLVGYLESCNMRRCCCNSEFVNAISAHLGKVELYLPCCWYPRAIWHPPVKYGTSENALCALMAEYCSYIFNLIKFYWQLSLYRTLKLKQFSLACWFVRRTNLFSSRFAQLYTQDLGLDKAACSVPRVHTVAICMEDPSRDYFSLLWWVFYFLIIAWCNYML